MNAIEEKIAIIRKASQQLNALAKQSYTLDDLKYTSEAEEYDSWLAETANKLSDFVNEQKELLEATHDMQKMSMSFNTAYLMLQQKISHENKQFTMVSNIMKYKHDTVQTIINNVR